MVKVKKKGSSAVIIISEDELLSLDLVRMKLNERFDGFIEEGRNMSMSDLCRFILTDFIGTKEIPKDFFEKNESNYDEADFEYADWLRTEIDVMTDWLGDLNKILDQI